MIRVVGWQKLSCIILLFYIILYIIILFFAHQHKATGMKSKQDVIIIIKIRPILSFFLIRCLRAVYMRV